MLFVVGQIVDLQILIVAYSKLECEIRERTDRRAVMMMITAMEPPSPPVVSVVVG